MFLTGYGLPDFQAVLKFPCIKITIALAEKSRQQLTDAAIKFSQTVTQIKKSLEAGDRSVAAQYCDDMLTYVRECITMVQKLRKNPNDKEKKFNRFISAQLNCLNDILKDASRSKFLLSDIEPEEQVVRSPYTLLRRITESTVYTSYHVQFSKVRHYEAPVRDIITHYQYRTAKWSWNNVLRVSWWVGRNTRMNQLAFLARVKRLSNPVYDYLAIQTVLKQINREKNWFESRLKQILQKQLNAFSYAVKRDAVQAISIENFSSALQQVEGQTLLAKTGHSHESGKAVELRTRKLRVF